MPTPLLYSIVPIAPSPTITCSLTSSRKFKIISLLRGLNLSVLLQDSETIGQKSVYVKLAGFGLTGHGGFLAAILQVFWIGGRRSF
jgi:hypothetical protein